MACAILRSVPLRRNGTSAIFAITGSRSFFFRPEFFEIFELTSMETFADFMLSLARFQILPIVCLHTANFLPTSSIAHFLSLPPVRHCFAVEVAAGHRRVRNHSDSV